MKAYHASVMLAVLACLVLVPMAGHTAVGSTTILWAGIAEWYTLVALVAWLPYAYVRAQWWAIEEVARTRALQGEGSEE